MSDIAGLPSLSPAGARQIDQTCDRFEASWKAGQRPRPEDYVSTASEPERSALLRQLLLLDWEYRRRAGDEPRAGDYHARFPGDSAVIEDVGREITESPVSTHRGSDGPHGQDTPWFGAAAERMENPSHAESGAARYELGRELGHGGIGVVFRGRDRLLGRELAVKVLREDYRDHADARRRFAEEARVGSQLQHPAIVPVYEQGWFSDRRPYFTMKLVEGHTLAALLQSRTHVGQDSNPARLRQDRNPAPQPDLPRLLGIFEQVCQAMAYAHARGVVHRDLKPANVMVGAFGEVQVMDWGLAKQLRIADCGMRISEASQDDSEAEFSIRNPQSAIRNSAGATHSGLLMGTPAYMPPEQARGHAALIDPRADVFALGAILCEILTGRPPYVGDSSEEVCAKAAEGDLEAAHARLDACGADEELHELAKRCLVAERSARPPDAAVVAKELTAYLASAQERLRRAELERAAAEARARAERRARRLTLALAAAAVVLLASAGAGWWWYDRARQAQDFRVAATDGKVEAALVEAAGHVDRNGWPQASAALTRARELLESGASDHWKARVDETRADLDIVAELDAIRRSQQDRSVYALGSEPSRFLREKVLPRYARAFARYGIRVGGDPAEAAARVTQRPAAVRDALVAGLASWWLIALGRDAAAHEWVGAVLQTADPDEWRTRVRQAVVTQDRRRLQELAAQADIARQPLATVTFLGWALLDFKAYDAAVTLLRPAQRRFPDNFWINLELATAYRLRRPPDDAEALRFYSIALALSAEGPIYVNLGYFLVRQKDWDGIIFVSRKALELNPDSAEAYNHLGLGLRGKDDLQQAEAAYRKSLELNPGLATVHYNLGITLLDSAQVDQAAVAFEHAVRLAPDDAESHNNLGLARLRQGDLDAALAEFAKAIELRPGLTLAHINRGLTLRKKGRLDDVIAAFEAAVRVDPTSDKAHTQLGHAWSEKGLLDRAVAAYSRAAELNPGSALRHYNLGVTLHDLGEADRAIAAYREAVRLDPKYAEAHCNLRSLLQEQGRFAEALAEIEEGHRLGSANPNWRYPSAKWLKEAQRLVELNAKLPGILDGSEKPATVEEQLEYAGVCRLKRLYAASVRLYVGVFTAEPALAQSPETRHRFLAASAAALAGTGQGRDDPKLDAPERVRLRKQALDWLRADLALWADRLQRSPQSHSAVQSALEFWRSDKALAGIREPQELAKLPESERAGCIRFWGDVQELLVRSLASAPGK